MHINESPDTTLDKMSYLYIMELYKVSLRVVVMSYDLCVFDLDGTLTDPKLGIINAYQFALAAFGIQEEPCNMDSFIGPPLREIFSITYGFSGPDTEKAVAKFREYYSESGKFENSVYPGIPELLRHLKDNGKTLAVATNKVIPYTIDILRHFDLERFFAFVSGDEMDGSLTKNGKRDIIQVVLDTLNPELKLTSVMIGDRKHDMRGAWELGIFSIGVTWGYGSRTELEEARATHIVDTPKELQGLLMEGVRYAD
jgi:phosphoglycolate phosphatase